VGIEQSDILIASFSEEPGRALDVRHNERDDASRQSERSLGRLHDDQASASPTCTPAARHRFVGIGIRSCLKFDQSDSVSACCPAGATMSACVADVKARTQLPPSVPVCWPPYSWKVLLRMARCSSDASPRRQPTTVSREVAPSISLESSVKIATRSGGIQIVSATSCLLVRHSGF
jgi:hypothetical protein